jgi:hypothetical protein
MIHGKRPIGGMTAYEVIKYLDKQYPHKCAQPGESLEDIHRAAGARALVDSLLTKLHHEDT